MQTSDCDIAMSLKMFSVAQHSSVVLMQLCSQDTSDTDTVLQAAFGKQRVLCAKTGKRPSLPWYMFPAPVVYAFMTSVNSCMMTSSLSATAMLCGH